MIKTMLFVLALGMLLPTSAHAYLDPGSGSMMVQLLLAGVAGVAVAIRIFWRRLLVFFGLSKDSPSDKKKPSS